MNKLIAIDKYAARVLMLSFFLPMKLQGLAAMALGLYFIIRTFAAKQKVPAVNYLWAFIIGSSFLLYLSSVLITPHEYVKTLLHICEHRVSLLLMPVAFAIFSPSFSMLLMDELIYFVYGCFITCLAANADVLYHYYYAQGGMHNFTHVQYRNIVHFFTDNHPTYLGLYLCFSICILLFSSTVTRAGTIIKNVLLFSLLIFLLALGPKTPILALGVIFIHFAYVHRTTLFRHMALLAMLVAAVAAAWFFIPFLGQRVKETIQGISSTDNVYNSVSMRKVIWNMDVSMLKEYWLTGTGPGRLIHTLQERYFFFSLTNRLPVAFYDPHSEYFYEWLSLGIIGIVVFAGILIIHFRKALLNKDHLYLYLLIILCTTFFTESVLTLQRGILFYAVLTSLFFFRKAVGKAPSGPPE